MQLLCFAPKINVIVYINYAAIKMTKKSSISGKRMEGMSIILFVLSICFALGVFRIIVFTKVTFFFYFGLSTEIWSHHSLEPYFISKQINTDICGWVLSEWPQ